MSGMLAPSVVSYQYLVDSDFSKYVNVSFPWRVRITDVWFTGDSKLLGDNWWQNQADSYRKLVLGAIKGKSPKNVLSSYDVPTDWAPFFGYDTPENQDQWTWGSEEFKPQMWLGLPDDATIEQLKNQTTQYMGNPYYGSGFRSSSSKPPALKDWWNPYWGNDGWSSEQFAQWKYKTDMGVMNPDEMVSFFVYADGGDWDDYQNDGMVTINVAYEGVGWSTQPADTATPWSDWFYD